MLKKLAAAGATLTAATGLGMWAPATAAPLSEYPGDPPIRLTCSAPILFMNETAARRPRPTPPGSPEIEFTCTIVQVPNAGELQAFPIVLGQNGVPVRGAVANNSATDSRQGRPFTVRGSQAPHFAPESDESDESAEQREEGRWEPRRQEQRHQEQRHQEPRRQWKPDERPHEESHQESHEESEEDTPWNQEREWRSEGPRRGPEENRERGPRDWREPEGPRQEDSDGPDEGGFWGLTGNEWEQEPSWAWGQDAFHEGGAGARAPRGHRR